jgi:DNA-binding protein H-NS
MAKFEMKITSESADVLYALQDHIHAWSDHIECGEIQRIKEKEPAPQPHHRRRDWGRKLPPKYRNPKTGETWAGRGAVPTWLKSLMKRGNKRNDYLIDPSQRKYPAREKFPNTATYVLHLLQNEAAASLSVSRMYKLVKEDLGYTAQAALSARRALLTQGLATLADGVLTLTENGKTYQWKVEDSSKTRRRRGERKEDSLLVDTPPPIQEQEPEPERENVDGQRNSLGPE